MDQEQDTAMPAAEPAMPNEEGMVAPEAMPETTETSDEAAA